MSTPLAAPFSGEIRIEGKFSVAILSVSACGSHLWFPASAVPRLDARQPFRSPLRNDSGNLRSSIHKLQSAPEVKWFVCASGLLLQLRRPFDRAEKGG